MTFREESFPLAIDYGSSLEEVYSNTTHTTSSGGRYVKEYHPYPILTYEIGLNNRVDQWLIENILALYHRCRGGADGFRVKNHADFSTNGYKGTPTSIDQLCIVTTTSNIYQMVKWYGTEGDTTQARRNLYKPVTGTALVSIDNQTVTTDFSVGYTTGLITFTDNPHSITGITKASQAVVTATANDHAVGDWVYFSSVGGMVELNGNRYEIVARATNTVTIDVNTTAFTTYTSGGTINTAPQTGEEVRCGCLFDIPMYFESDLSGLTWEAFKVMSLSVVCRETLNP